MNNRSLRPAWVGALLFGSAIAIFGWLPSAIAEPAPQPPAIVCEWLATGPVPRLIPGAEEQRVVLVLKEGSADNCGPFPPAAAGSAAPTSSAAPTRSTAPARSTAPGRSTAPISSVAPAAPAASSLPPQKAIVLTRDDGARLTGKLEEQDGRVDLVLTSIPSTLVAGSPFWLLKVGGVDWTIEMPVEDQPLRVRPDAKGNPEMNIHYAGQEYNMDGWHSGVSESGVAVVTPAGSDSTWVEMRPLWQLPSSLVGEVSTKVPQRRLEYVFDRCVKEAKFVAAHEDLLSAQRKQEDLNEDLVRADDALRKARKKAESLQAESSELTAAKDAFSTASSAALAGKKDVAVKAAAFAKADMACENAYLEELQRRRHWQVEALNWKAGDDAIHFYLAGETWLYGSTTVERLSEATFAITREERDPLMLGVELYDTWPQESPKDQNGSAGAAQSGKTHATKRWLRMQLKAAESAREESLPLPISEAVSVSCGEDKKRQIIKDAQTVGVWSKQLRTKGCKLHYQPEDVPIFRDDAEQDDSESGDSEQGSEQDKPARDTSAQLASAQLASAQTTSAQTASTRTTSARDKSAKEEKKRNLSDEQREQLRLAGAQQLVVTVSRVGATAVEKTWVIPDPTREANLQLVVPEETEALGPFTVEAHVDGGAAPTVRYRPAPNGTARGNRTATIELADRQFTAHLRPVTRGGWLWGPEGGGMRIFATVPVDPLVIRFPARPRDMPSSTADQGAQQVMQRVGVALVLEPWNFNLGKNPYFVRYEVGTYLFAIADQGFDPSFFTGIKGVFPLLNLPDNTAKDQLGTDVTLGLLLEVPYTNPYPYLLFTMGLDVLSLIGTK